MGRTEMGVEKVTERTLGGAFPAERRRLQRLLTQVRAGTPRPARPAPRPVPSRRPRGATLQSPAVRALRSTVRVGPARPTRPPPADTRSRTHSRVLPEARTHSMTIRCFVSRPFSMENQGDQAMIATGSFEERDTFREA
ncbi:hypothetical protein H8959_002297 [Pygathrix nigripes]